MQCWGWKAANVSDAGLTWVALLCSSWGNLESDHFCSSGSVPQSSMGIACLRTAPAVERPPLFEPPLYACDDDDYFVDVGGKQKR